MTRLLLVRHGESDANFHNIFAGHIDPALQPRGIEQAELTAQFITENYKVDKIYSSDLQRAYRTAESLGKRVNLTITADENLREIRAGEWEGVNFFEVPKLHPEAFRIWSTDIGNGYCPGGETVRELSDRILGELTKISEENDGKTVAIFSHATPIRVAQSIVETGSLDGMQEIPWVSNASVTEITYENGKWNLIAVSLEKHLAELKTELASIV